MEFRLRAAALLGGESDQVFEKWSEVDPEFAERLPAIALSLGLVREALAFDLWQMDRTKNNFASRALASAIEYGESSIVREIFALVDAEGVASVDDTISMAGILIDAGKGEDACALLRCTEERGPAWQVLWVKALLSAGAPEAGDLLLALLETNNQVIHKNTPVLLQLADGLGLLADQDYFVPNLLERCDPSYLQVVLGAVLNAGSFVSVKEGILDFLIDTLEEKDENPLWRGILRGARRNDPREAVGSLNAIYVAAGIGGVAFGPGDGNALARLTSTPTYAGNNGPLVSVVICCFDAQDTIGYALSSVAQQSHKELEIIVIDDHSPEPLTLNPAWSHGRQVRLHRNTENLGPYLSRNVGIDMAKGEIIAFHDADDWCHPDKISHQIKEMKDGNGLAHYGSHIRLSPEGAIRAENNGGILGHGPITGIMHRKVFRACGQFLNTRTRGDIEFRRRIEARLGMSSVLSNRVPYVLALDWNSNSKRLTKDTQQRRALKHFLLRANAMQRLMGFALNSAKAHHVLDSLAKPISRGGM